MTGELVLQQLKELESGKQYAARLGAALAKQGIQKLIDAREAFEDEGGIIHMWKDPISGERFCKLVLDGCTAAIAHSMQGSADAESHAFQNLNNDRFNAANKMEIEK